MATLKQKKAAEFIAKGDSVSKAMKKAGYTEASAKNPRNLTKSQSFIEIMEKHGITDDKLSTVLNEGLAATKAVVMGTKSEESFVDIQPDFAIRHKYLETALKLKGHTKESTTNNITIKYKPLLGGDSVRANNSNKQIIDIDPEN